MYAVALLLDPISERKLQDVARRIGGWDPGIPPHLTLATYERGDRTKLERAMRAFPAGAMSGVLASAGTFPGAEGVVFAAPVATRTLLDLHARWHRENPGAHVHYLPGSWVPHCTLARSLPAAGVGEAVAAVRAALPLEVHFQRFALIESLDAAKVLFSIDLTPTR